MFFSKLRSLLLCIFIIHFFQSDIFAGEDDAVSIYFYSEIPGCGCFDHCKCFSHYISDVIGGGFPDNKPLHPLAIEDKIWHEFMRQFLTAKAVGPYFPTNRNHIHQLVSDSVGSRYACLLSDYLNALTKLAKIQEQAVVDNIEGAKRTYYKPSEAALLNERIVQINSQGDKARKILATIPEIIVPLYKELIQSCPHKESYNLVPLYNRGLIMLLEGEANEALEDICQFIQQARQNGNDNLLTSEMFVRQGEAYIEVGLYHEAITSLSEAINKDPKNLEAYFQRASAYFETGDFEKSFKDYISSKKSDQFVSYRLSSNEFVDAFSKAACNGACDSVSDYFPSLCSTAYGLGECLWAFGEHPVDSIRNFADASYEMANQVVDYLKTVDRDTLHEYANELVTLYDNFNQLSDQEKGGLIGYAVGKYGVDIFSGFAVLKGVSAYTKLKEANRVCNFESMIISTASKDSVASAALRQCNARRTFFENSKINWDKQNKHIPGKHNYLEGRSIFEHSNPQELLDKFAGKGLPIKNRVPGAPDYREKVNFGEFIGYHVNEKTGIKTPTTWGEIRYSNTGAHIIPSFPK